MVPMQQTQVPSLVEELRSRRLHGMANLHPLPPKKTSEEKSVGFHELGQTLEDGERQGSLMCYSPRGSKELDMMWRHRLSLFNWNPINPKGKTEKTFQLQQVGVPPHSISPSLPTAAPGAHLGNPELREHSHFYFTGGEKDAGNETRGRWMACSMVQGSS